jgi:hypothetical protein
MPAISAKAGTNIDELLDLVLLLAELQEYKADPALPAQRPGRQAPDRGRFTFIYIAFKLSLLCKILCL